MFRGFKYPLTVATAGGRVAEERRYEQYVKHLIYQVLLTRPGERINRPEFGGGVQALVFEPLSEDTTGLARAAVLGSLNEWLSAFILVEDVRITKEPPSSLVVKVVYIVRATNEQHFLNVEVTE